MTKISFLPSKFYSRIKKAHTCCSIIKYTLGEPSGLEKSQWPLCLEGWAEVEGSPPQGALQRWACAESFMSWHSWPSEKNPGCKSRVFLFNVKLSYLDETVVPVTWPTLATSELWHNAVCGHWNVWNTFEIANLKANHSATFLCFRVSNNLADSIYIFLVILFF